MLRASTSAIGAEPSSFRGREAVSRPRALTVDFERLEAELEAARRRVEALAARMHKRGADEAAFAAAMDAEADAERALAAARGDEYAVPMDIGAVWSGGAPLPHLLASGGRTFLAFYLEDDDPDWDGTYARIVDPASGAEEALALVELVGCVSVKMGSPNDEVLHGHPLYRRGLGGYGTYVVENSRWLAELIEINRVHDRFDPDAWRDAKHFMLVFHDETVDAVADRIEVQPVRGSMRAVLKDTVDRLWTAAT
jgi:hypothetical protein